jgi:hypothetical protein
MAERIIFTTDSMAAMRGDAPPWQSTLAGHLVSVATSIPDVSETGQSADTWRGWFVEAAMHCARQVSRGGLFIAMQSDVRSEGWWIDKSALVAQGVAASDTGLRLVARKVLCRKPAGTSSTRRASFTHAIIYAHQPLTLIDTMADVVADAGASTWKRGIGADATWQLLRFHQRHAPSVQTLFDPFCGEGLMLAQANHLGLRAVGVERHHKRAQQAQRMRAEPQGSADEDTTGHEGINDADELGGLDR